MSFRNHAEDCRVQKFNELGMLQSHYGEPDNLCIVSNRVGWIYCVSYSDCNFLINYCWLRVWNQHTDSFCDSFNWGHSTCFVRLWYVIYIFCDRFCCSGSVENESLGFGTCYTRGASDLHRQVGEMNETLFGINDYTFVSHEVQTYDYPLEIFIAIKCSAKLCSAISNLSVVVANSFSKWPFAPWIWKLGGSSFLKILAGVCCLILSNSFWAIALTKAFESARTSFVRPFWKFRVTYSLSSFRFRTIVEDSGMWGTSVVSSLTSLSTTCEVVNLKKGNWTFP